MSEVIDGINDYQLSISLFDPCILQITDRSLYLRDRRDWIYEALLDSGFTGTSLVKGELFNITYLGVVIVHEFDDSLVAMVEKLKRKLSRQYPAQDISIAVSIQQWNTLFHR